ncbi:LysR family transcriptional regulator [Bosea sp. RAF48]|uniref:LysR family transcriptional regulator n=1 Tax=Bosea sp. RAF48 TaxID=3237480 RepID=UPI003F91377D
MTPRLLQTFLAVARCRTATRAASELNLAQSSVSDQIQILEDTLGASLFLRSKQGFRLTAAGEALVPYAQEILTTMDDAQAAVKIASLSGDRSLVIGTLETVAAEVLPALLADLRQNQPELRMRIEVAGSDHLLQRLLDGSNDIAFLFRRGALDERLARREFAREPLVMIGPPAVGSAFAPPSDPVALAAEPFITTEPGCVYRHLFDQAWRRAGLTPPRPFAEVGSIEAIVRLVAAGSGYALVPRLAAREALARSAVAAIPSPGFELVATLDMVWRRRRVQSPGLTLLLARAGRARRSLKRDDDHPRREERCPS